MSDWKIQLEHAVASGLVSQSSLKNIKMLLAGTKDTFSEEVVSELVAQSQWDELNDRFYQTLSFGTGGLRGRTIGRFITEREQGKGGHNGAPEHPCVGTATMNFYNVGRAVRGLIYYVKSYVEKNSPTKRPKLVFAHDTRHFSPEFAAYCANICIELGCDAYLFNGARSTPQLSYTLRDLKADAGVVLTASHNPSHDNGFKAYFNDGGQIVEPDASLIMKEVNALTSEVYDIVSKDKQGQITEIPESFDQEYMDRLKSTLLNPRLLEQEQAVKVVYTNLHGTGGHLIVPLLKDLGFEVFTVKEQDTQDGRFPTVESPNPENAPALKLAIELAEQKQADVVIGTDPDTDRMGVAVRNRAGDIQLLTGNQIGSLMAWYRTKTMLETGWITESNRSRSTLIKTYVTTELQSLIAQKFGVCMVNTLTGFKYISEKLKKYEFAIPLDRRGDYRSLSEEESRTLRLEYSKFFIFGGEESYGYLGADFVRDKDGNGAVVMFAELAAYAISQSKTVADLLDDLYLEFGVHEEMGQSLVMEGAEGAMKIKGLNASYNENPPQELAGSKVTSIQNFAQDLIFDEEGDEVPKAAMIKGTLEDGRSFAIRPSGTEPKIKYYLFNQDSAGAKDLEASKIMVHEGLEQLWSALEEDAHARMKAL